MRLDFIGLVGLTYVPLLLAIPETSTLQESPRIAVSAAFVVVCLFALTISPAVQSAVSSGPIGPVIDLNHYTIRQRPWTLFTARHTIGIYEYRVEHTLEGGEVVEPLEVFRVDGSPGRHSARLFQPRYLQAAMYPISDYAHYRSYGLAVSTAACSRGGSRTLATGNRRRRSGDELRVSSANPATRLPHRGPLSLRRPLDHHLDNERRRLHCAAIRPNPFQRAGKSSGPRELRA